MNRVQRGDVIQIAEGHAWAGCLALVCETKSFGCMAGIEIPEKGMAYIRLTKDDYYIIGRAVLVPASFGEEEDE